MKRLLNNSSQLITHC